MFKWVVKALTVNGWTDMKEFKTAVAAEQWMVSFIYENNYSPSDFNIVRREAK